MHALPAVRNTKIAVSKEFLKACLEEKINQFGFKDDDQIINIDLSSIPDSFMMEVKHQRQKEVEVVTR